LGAWAFGAGAGVVDTGGLVQAIAKTATGKVRRRLVRGMGVS
jgi:hypothetical protein